MTVTINDYETAIAALPREAILGNLCWFSIQLADVNLERARQSFVDLGLDESQLPTVLRPVDAFRKASNAIEHKFKEHDDKRSSIMVRAVGEDGAHCHRHVILERAEYQSGQRRRIFYEKVGEIVFTRGFKEKGIYHGYSVNIRKTTEGLHLSTEEAEYIDQAVAGFSDNFNRMMQNMDSHAVRSIVREYVRSLGATQVKESGGLYFVLEDRADILSRLGQWVKGIGSQWHQLPLLNLSEQRDMIASSLEEDTANEADRIMVEIGKILTSGRQIGDETWNGYVERVSSLRTRLDEYGSALDRRAATADTRMSMLSQQLLVLSGSVRKKKGFTL